MAPRKSVDKGKRPMSEMEPEPPRRSTRSRGLGIHLSEPRENPRRVVTEEAPVEPEQEAQEVPVAEQQTTETSGRGGATHPVGEQMRPGPSSMAPTVETVGVDSRLEAMMQLMMGVAQAVQQLAQAQSQQRVSSDPAPSTGPAARVQAPIREQEEETEVEVVDVRRRIQDERFDMKAFQEMKPPTYQGEMDFRVVDRWVAKMEKIFEYLRCTEEQRVRYATFMLEGDAEEWWRSEREILPHRGGDLTWAEFLDLFFQQYIPASERTRRAAEFASLTQGKLSVAAYDSQFRALCKFVAWTQLDPREKARKFQEGLKPSIRGKLAVLGLQEYSDILDRARRVEREEEEWMKVQERRRGPEQRRGGRVQGRGQRPRQEERKQLPVCATCGRQHTGTCMTGRGACYSCGQRDHGRRDCPHRNATCQLCGKMGHIKDACFQAQGRAPQRVQQQQMVRAPVPARGQRGRPLQFRQ